MSPKPGKGARIKAQPMKISRIHIPKKDYPESGQYPPNSGAFDELRDNLKHHGMLIPVFIDANGVLLQGHYRLWAWQTLGNKHVPVVVVESIEEIDKYFD